MESKGMLQNGKVSLKLPAEQAIDLVRDFWKNTHEREESAAEKSKRARLPIENLTVGTCRFPGCEGAIVYTSRIESYQPLVGGTTYSREFTACHCEVCGIAYGAYFPEFRKQIERLRGESDSEEV